MPEYKIPIGRIGEDLIGFIVTYMQGPVTAFSILVKSLDAFIFTILTVLPPLVWVAALSLIAWRLSGRGLAAFALISLSLLINQGLWTQALETLSLTLTATLLSLAIAVPMGIVAGENERVDKWLSPVLDFVQTMPRFVYLIPAVILFGIDVVPAVFATMTLAIVPPLRIISLAIRQVDPRLVEAAFAFGATRWNVLTRIKLPLIGPALVLAVNQCLLMALSMAVITALIGAGGLGEDVLGAIAILDAGKGFVAGFGILVLAILIDRILNAVVAANKAQPVGKRTSSV